MRRVVWVRSCTLLSLALSVVITSAADTPPAFALVIAQHRLSPQALRVKSTAPFILVITNKDTDEEVFAMASLRIEKIIPSGTSLQRKMPVLKPGTSECIGDFHEKTAKGRIVAE